MAFFTKYSYKIAKKYACFQVLKSLHQNGPWWLWDDEFRNPIDIRCIETAYVEECDFHIFLQYIFFAQWNELKRYANDKGIFILGDLPIYAAPVSSDVWANQALFQLDSVSSSFQKNQEGDLLSRITSDTAQLQSALLGEILPRIA